MNSETVRGLSVFFGVSAFFLLLAGMTLPTSYFVPLVNLSHVDGEADFLFWAALTA